MPRPGVVVNATTDAPASGVPTDTGQWFVAGLTTSGPVGVAQKVTSISSFVSKFGARASFSYLYDALETYFREGGTTAFVSRVVGSGSLRASTTFNDATAATIKVEAKHVGEYGNDLDASVEVVSSTFRVNVYDVNNKLIEQTPYFASRTDAAAYNAQTIVISTTGAGGNPVAAAAKSLAGGVDGRANVVDATYADALKVFSRDLGPGQVSVPGVSTAAVQAALFVHAGDYNRVALPDLPNTPLVTTYASTADALRASANGAYGAFFGPWAVIPGLVGGTTRQVPYSAVQAGLIARNDQFFSPGRAVAGHNYPLQFVIDLVGTFTDADRETALLKGVNLAKNVYGSLQTYGFRSAVDPAVDASFVQFNYARQRMALSAELQHAADGFVFETIDGAGHTISAFENALTGVLLDAYSSGDLYGDVAEEAFRVETGPSVNTVESIALGQLNATVRVRMSPHAELVTINLTKTPLTESV